MRQPVSRRIVQVGIGLFLACGSVLGGIWAWQSGEDAVRRYTDILAYETQAVSEALDYEITHVLADDPDQSEYLRLEEHLQGWARVRNIPRVFILFEESREMKLGPEAGIGFSGESVNIDELLPLPDRQQLLHLPGENRPLVALFPSATHANLDRDVFVGIETDPNQLDIQRREGRRIPLICTGTYLLVLAAAAVLLLRRKGGRYQFAEILSILLIASHLSITMYIYTRIQEESSRADRFSLVADIKASFLAEELRDIQSDLDGIGRFFEGSIFVDPWEYQAYTNRLTWNGTVKAWQWIPQLTEEQLEQRSILLESFGAGPVASYAPSGAAPAEEGIYHPVLYVEPLPTQKFMIGYETSAHPSRFEAIQQARKTGMMQAADMHELPEDLSNCLGTLIMRPVFRGGNYIGSIAAVLAYEQFIPVLLQDKHTDSGLILSMETITSEGNKVPVIQPSGEAGETAGLSAAVPVFLFGKTYMIFLQPGEQFFEENPLYYSRTVLYSGGLLTALLTILVAFSVNHRQLLERIVNRRTRELAAANRRTKEILNGLDVCVFVTSIEKRELLFKNYACRNLENQIGLPPQKIFFTPDIQEREVHLEAADRIFRYRSRRISWGFQAMARLEVVQDITEQKHTLQALRKIEWMLSPAEEKTEMDRENRVFLSKEDVEKQNSREAIYRAVGYEHLEHITSEIIALTETSAAVYEQDGRYAYFVMNLSWCRALREEKSSCCKNEKLIQAVLSVVSQGKQREVTCEAGMRFIIVPIFAGNECIGAIHLGYGDPPDAGRIAAQLHILPDEDQREEPQAYESRPEYIIELAKNRLTFSAELIGEMVEKEQSEENRKRLMQELMHVQKIESVGRLAGGVAHDFNNMLAVILGYVDLSLQELDSTQPAYEYLQEIKEAAGRSADLTRQLLTFARKQPGTFIALDLNKHIRGMLNMLQRLIGKQTIITFQGQEDLWSVVADPSQVDQILTNLVSNAADALPANGQIGVLTRNCTVYDGSDTKKPSKPGDYVELTVWDSGEGIDRDQIEQLFDPFYTTKEAGKGTGLGLSTVYGIVTQHDGEVKVESKKGEGSSFRIFFPRTEQPISQQEGEDQDMIHGSGETILLVEDEISVRQFAETALANHGYRVISCTSPEQALKKIQETDGAVDLLLTDLVMPGMNGRELWEQGEYYCPGLSVLYTSGYPSAVFSEEELKKVHLLQKPFTVASLLRKVHETL